MTGYESKKAAARDKLKCQCSMTTKLVGSGCQYCNPEYLEDDDIQVYQRPWVGLTDDEVYKIAFALEGEHWRKIADAIEAKLKEKNEFYAKN